MHRAMPLPQNHARPLQPLAIEPSVQHVRVPHHHFVERNSEPIPGVASEMLIGKEKKFRGFLNSPLKRPRRIRRGANHSAAFAAKRFDGSCGIHVRDRRNAVSLRSEEHTSELQSLAYLVCRLLLEKKK